MFSIDVNPPGGSVGVDEGEAEVNRTKHLPLQHLCLVTTEVKGTSLQHEVTLASGVSECVRVCVCVCVCVSVRRERYRERVKWVCMYVCVWRGIRGGVEFF